MGVESKAPPLPAKGTAVSRLGDLWLLEGGHKLFNGSAREGASYEVLLGSEEVQMVLTDPPYGCAIKGHVSRSHGEFVEGSGLGEGEMNAFFQDFIKAMIMVLAAAQEDVDEARRRSAKLAALSFEVACFGHGPPITTGADRRFRTRWS